MPLLNAILPAPGAASEVVLSNVIDNCEFVPAAPAAPVLPVAPVAPVEPVAPVSPLSPCLVKCTDNSSAAEKVLFDPICVTASLLYPEASVDAPVIENLAYVLLSFMSSLFN